MVVKVEDQTSYDILEGVKEISVETLIKHSDSPHLNVLAKILTHRDTPFNVVEKILKQHPVLIATYASGSVADKKYCVELAKQGLVHPAEFANLIPHNPVATTDAYEETFFDFFLPYVATDPWLSSALLRSLAVPKSFKEQVKNESLYVF